MRKRVAKKRTYTDPNELRNAVNEYFEEADNNESPYTISGLCLHIGFSRDMFFKHGHDGEFGDVIQQARLLIEQQHEIRLLTTKKPTGTIFALKNLGWSDRSFLDVGISGGVAGSGEPLKWTVEVIAPGEPRNKRGKVPKMKTALDQPKYDPPVLSKTASDQMPVPVPTPPIPMVKRQPEPELDLFA